MELYYYCLYYYGSTMKVEDRKTLVQCIFTFGQAFASYVRSAIKTNGFMQMHSKKRDIPFKEDETRMAYADNASGGSSL